MKALLYIVAAFLVLFFLPVGWPRFDNAVDESLHLVRWYAREHVLLCLVPAFFIAGAIGVFVRQQSVLRYLGGGASKVLAYGVASVSGSILAVCSCTVLPLFAGIYRMGAGIGPASAFLYSGPAINVLAIILTARILGPDLGIARAVGAVLFSILIGLAMHWIYRKEEQQRLAACAAAPQTQADRPLWQTALFFAAMVGVLVFANWGRPAESEGFWVAVHAMKWQIAAGFGLLLGLVLVAVLKIAWWKVALAAVPPAGLALALPSTGLWPLIPFTAGSAGLAVVTAKGNDEGRQWLEATWEFAKQILPLLLAGVLVAGFLLGRPDREGLIPSKYVQMLVGADPGRFLAETNLGGTGWEGPVRALWSVWTNLFASIFGVFMYFATLTEVPILQGLIGSGMGKGPALALLLSGPALSLPSMLVLRSVLGVRKTIVFCLLVVVMATASGMIFERIA